MATVFKPPSPVPFGLTDGSIFLAGSIDMGSAVNWQAEVERRLQNHHVAIFNPRRDDWDSTWEQDIAHDGFRGQVTWELDMLDRADVILFYFDPQGKSPVTMLELGRYITTGKCVVCCPKGFWRRGNVQIVCARYGVRLHETLDEAIESAVRMLITPWIS